MRPQQNRRMRGRGNNNNNSNNNGGGGNNNRKGPNPLTRSYESNGPDVKIRGSAQQVAEKYTTLARDAQSAGDRVMAENYLQHAEHYNRIIATALAQQAAQQQQHNVRDEDDEDGDDNDSGFDTNQRNDQQPRGDYQQRGDRQNERQGRDNRDQREPRENRGEEQSRHVNGFGPQPVIEGVPAEVALKQADGEGESRRARQPRREREVPRTDVQPNESVDAAPPAPPVGDEQQQGEDAPRKQRRPRRPRVKADEGETGDEPKSDDVGEAAA